MEGINNKQLSTIHKKINKKTVFTYFIASFIIVVSSVSFFYRVAQKNATFFGSTIFTITSRSMTETGFDAGESVLLNTHKETYKAGDNIAFYSMQDPFNPLPDVYQNSLTQLEDIKKISKIWFHEVVSVVNDSNDVLWYETRGTSNNGNDSILIREDLVVGSYKETPKWFRGFLTFIKSEVGLSTLVLIPNAILLNVFIFYLLEGIERVSLEKQVLKSKLSITNPLSIEKKIYANFSLKQRIFIYEQTPEEEKEEAMKLLFKDYTN